jgi:hypothetical protein
VLRLWAGPEVHVVTNPGPFAEWSKREGLHEAMHKAMTENDLLIAVTEALTLHGWLWTHPRRSDKALTMGTPGVPDIIAVKEATDREPGRLLFIELKREDAKPTLDQQRWLDALRILKVPEYLLEPGSQLPRMDVRVLRPSGLDAFLEELGS